MGGKTGFTDLARHTYVGAARRNGRRLVVTLLGAEAQPIRAWQQGAALLDWGFALPSNAAVGRLVAPGEAERLLHPPTPSGAPSAAVIAHVSQPVLTWPPAVLGGLGIAVAVPLIVFATLYRRRRTARRVRNYTGPNPVGENAYRGEGRMHP